MTEEIFEHDGRTFPSITGHGVLRGLAKTLAEFGGSGKAQDGSFDGGGIGWWNEEAVEAVFDDIGHAASFGGDDGHAGSHGLKDDGGKTFHERREKKNVVGGEEFVHLVGRHGWIHENSGGEFGAEEIFDDFGRASAAGEGHGQAGKL